MKYLTALLACGAILQNTPARAEEDHVELYKPYFVQMTGCTDKAVADGIVAQAKERGTGTSAFRDAYKKGICGATVGDTVFTTLYEQYQDSGGIPGPVWYVEYKVNIKGTEKTFYGFCVIPVVEPPTL